MKSARQPPRLGRPPPSQRHGGASSIRHTRRTGDEWPSCRRRSRSWRRRRRRSAGRSARPSSRCSASRCSGRLPGTIDIVASAPGKVVPSGRTKIIQPFETGVVRAIHVRDGQSGQGGRRPDRTRPDDERSGTRSLRSDSSPRRPTSRACGQRLAARTIRGRLRAARRRRPGAGRMQQQS